MDHSKPIKPSKIHIFWEAYLKCNGIVGNALKNDFVSYYNRNLIFLIFILTKRIFNLLEFKIFKNIYMYMFFLENCLV